MIKTIAILFAMTAGLQVHAQTLKVIKVKGKRAIVEAVSGSLTPGQTLAIGSGDDFGFEDEPPAKGKGAGDHSGPRTHFVGGSGSFYMTKPPGSTQTTTVISASALYGWNPGNNNMEYGALLDFSSASGGGTSSSSFGVGGKFDYDFTNNKAPLEGLFSAGAQATVGQTSSGGTSYTQFSVFPMVSYKYFILKTPTCVRADAGVKAVMSSGGKTGSSTDTNPAVQVGLFTYF